MRPLNRQSHTSESLRIIVHNIARHIYGALSHKLSVVSSGVGGDDGDGKGDEGDDNDDDDKDDDCDNESHV